MRDVLSKLLELHAVITAPVSEVDTESLKASDEAVSKLPVPFVMYEVNYKWRDDTLVACEVEPVTITRVGINTAAYAVSPSVDFVDATGRRAHGSADLFYLKKEHADLEAAQVLSEARKEEATAEFETLLLQHLPAIVELAQQALVK